MVRVRGTPLTAALFCLFVFVSACGHEVEVELLDVTAVTPERLEPGGVLVIEGRGFPVGRDGWVELEGQALISGEPASPVVH